MSKQKEVESPVVKEAKHIVLRAMNQTEILGMKGQVAGTLVLDTDTFRIKVWTGSLWRSI